MSCFRKLCCWRTDEDYSSRERVPSLLEEEEDEDDEENDEEDEEMMKISAEFRETMRSYVKQQQAESLSKETNTTFYEELERILNDIEIKREGLPEGSPSFSSSSSSSSSTTTTLSSSTSSPKEGQSLKEAEEGKQKTEDSLATTLLRLVQLLSKSVVQGFLLSNLLNERRRRAINKAEKVNLVQRLVNTLDEQQQQELFQIVGGLPSAVLGDEFAREHTRVLIDLNKDVRDSLTSMKLKVTREMGSESSALETVSGIMENLLQQVSSARQASLLADLLRVQVDPSDRYRLVLQQLLLSKLVPWDYDKRERLLRKVFIKSSSWVLLPPN